MGDRYILEVICPCCGYIDDDGYYAPTCGATDWVCSECGEKVDLAEYTGISHEECSNKEVIGELIDEVTSQDKTT